jgi:DNA-binding response OmpR family regulator
VAVVVLLTSEPALLDAWRSALNAQGHTTMVAMTTSAAVDHLHEGGVDVLLLDYEVAGGIGRLMVALERLPDPPPFVLISGAVDAPVVSARLGAAAFVPKPCAPEDLAALVARVAPPAVVAALDDRPTLPVPILRRSTSH